MLGLKPGPLITSWSCKAIQDISGVREARLYTALNRHLPRRSRKRHSDIGSFTQVDIPSDMRRAVGKIVCFFDDGCQDIARVVINAKHVGFPNVRYHIYAALPMEAIL